MGNEPTTQTARARPVHEIRLGAIRAAVWANETDNGTWYNVTFERSYKDGDTWKSTGSFGRDDLLVLAKAADQAHTWIVGQPRDRQEPEPSTAPTQPPRRMASGQPLKEARLPTQRSA
ncbi:MAG TPA: hypothetical protein PLX89_05600 [Verrucomicrobiota bacterium]|nr:hypothetical protein [Verrucomicrobiota bacterium]